MWAMMPSSSARSFARLHRIRHSIVMAAQPDLGSQVIEFRRRADELGGAADDGVKETVALLEAGDWKFD